ncbi:enoyl-CoA hydratase-related protein [Aeromicrobium sp. IC_218]|uniref:enoyl-CoA hydratase/isomerase family protein n=1 Tax=Aeromicrobium sp. IC_218 TaxID=2545468 RepID=UPI0013F3C155|nr:enoyl-CoA hydratase-related protein [Aeromicrobium sp. IC_218]
MTHEDDALDARETTGVRVLTVARGGGLDALAEGLHGVSTDTSARCVVLTGDLDLPVSDAADEAVVPTVVTALAALPQPVVVAVAGTARGAGLALACAADLRVLAHDACLDTGVDADALPPLGGLSWTLPRLLGRGRATDLLLRPRVVGAGEALTLGLATYVVPAPELDDEVQALAEELAARPPLAVAATKRSLSHAADDGLVGTMQVEAQRAAMLRRSRDHAEARAATAEGRPPVFEGR